VKAYGRNCAAVRADVTRVDDCEAVVAWAIAEFGHVDVLVNNAGVATAYPATREDPDEFRRVIDVNLNGSYWMAQACGRVMGPGSSIINIGSVLGSTTARFPHAAYSSSKAAIIGLTRDLAQQWTGRKGIRVNALAPGFFPSEISEAYADGYIESILPRVPAGRVGRLEELSAAAVFLASDASSYITGVLLPVDGGLLTG
jgi:NAD(P)-dependent dehydrogenase (short-subunit alcohol dehydrogenase family)